MLLGTHVAKLHTILLASAAIAVDNCETLRRTVRISKTAALMKEAGCHQRQIRYAIL